MKKILSFVSIIVLSLTAGNAIAWQSEGEDKTPSMQGKSGMGMMDKMTSGMSPMDQNDMKMMMDKVMAMPAAQRKKAMRKMSGMGQSSGADKMSGMGMGMGGKMSGMGMGMMDQMMSGMGSSDKSEMKMMMGKMMGMPPDARKMAMQKMGGMDKGMSQKMSGMGKGMMDQMMSGMGTADKSEMKMMMNKMIVMPPAGRKKAMQKLNGMGKKSSSSEMDKMTSGLSSTDKNAMKTTLTKVMAMPPAERKRAMEKMTGQPMTGNM